MKNYSKIKLKKGDLVRVTVGKDKGKQAKIERVFPKESRVLILGINQYKRHRKPQGEGRPGEILILDRPVPAANVVLVCPKCKQSTRIGYRFDAGKKIRVCRKCDADVD
ncbi:MAG: 50S ribosomal protein L24 [Candidatus Amesbacteria bacterium GW2011_GWA2_47_11]|uniref:Large ribosomal subunit protein uL24 n=3 Tax=Candidatus Amesiibacteriota TaxID=1752730 RepID=A0A0G1UKY6_9BACT|nr:MAG: 50S ribosomal protein L24 [Candidatus Amesbacteria bacterium GW2011_GWA2_47_11]KKU94852.1 MAG: 50S ribosomal protein L24 [Candidatus Amesbacteria bacterium GW2011_GWC1_48_10]KKW01040.1 MAG: 50S ribosomal protein L24 [Candidatus Amesbacteria bacterium GW2011_GWA1_48_9]